MKLNLGCGLDIKKGFVNVDIGYFNQEIRHDLNVFPYPFKDKTFTYVLMNHSIEHLKEPVKVMQEIHRVCKKGARIDIVVPYFSSPNMWSDPTHETCFNWHTFERFSGFKILKRELFFLSNIKSKHRSRCIDALININPLLYQRFLCYILPCSELSVLLETQ